ncbi:MAG: hypothetical protein H7274_17875 [Rhodoferax sp.]|nr:hypothetical protein [Rhodoferax sp.]
MSPPRNPYLQRLVVYGFAVAALSGVFVMYLQTDFMVTLAQQVWACF